MSPLSDEGAVWKARQGMVSSLRSIISSITEDITSIVHVGAGYCSDSELYQVLGVRSVTFVEPDAQLFDAASNKFLHSPQISVLQKAIAGKSEERVYFQLNNKRFSSLLEPGRIIEFYPNLAVVDKISVDAITLESLCDEIQIPTKKNSLLLLELQGEEENVLVHTPAHILQNFKWIMVRSSKETLYGKPTAPMGAIIKRSLNSAKFDALCFKEDNPVFCNYLFTRNDAALAKQALLKEKETALTDMQAMTKDKLNLVSERSSLNAQVKAFQKQNTDLAETLDAARKQSRDLTGEKEQLQTEAAKTAESLSTAQTEIDSARNQVSDLAVEKEEFQQQIDDLTSAHQSAQNELHEELKEANHALRINNKLVAKTDADLRDLQARYQTAIDNQKQQHSLLLELQDKLIQASKFYRQLDIQDQHIEGDVFSEDIERIENELDQNDEG